MAIRAGGQLTLTNAGTITGSVVGNSSGGFGDRVDNTAGVIDGGVTLGAGDDTLRVRFDAATGAIQGITGANGFDAPNGLVVGGVGTVVNNATLSTTGPAIDFDASGFPGAGTTLVNNRSITSTLNNANQFAVTANRVTNFGRIDATGGGAVAIPFFSSFTSSGLTNSGDITATGLAVSIGSGSLDNSGTIRSTGDRAVLIQSFSIDSINSGVIDGATTGVELLGLLVNTGTITGGETGVNLLFQGVLDNLAGGTVGGGTAAVRGGASSGNVVLNAGTLNGDVDFTSRSSFDFSQDIFIDEGGVVNGAVRLGGGDDLLVTDLIGRTGRSLAGATGVADGGAGTDLLSIDATGDGAVRGEQFIDFERVAQSGRGTVAYSGRFDVNTIELANSTLTVAAGARLATAGPVSVTGSDGSETVRNAGTIAGSLALGGGSDLVENSGVIEGDVRLGGGSFDAYVVLSGGATVGGTIDGGNDGFDAFVWRRSASDAITLDASRTTGFEFYLVQAFGAGTTVSLDGSLDGIGTLYLNGDGAVVNRASGAGGLSTFTPFSSSVLPMRDGPIASFTNEGQVAGGFAGNTSLFVNRGILGSDSLVRRNAVLQSADGALSFNNEGRILSAPTTGRGALLDVFDATRLDIANSGFISGGLSAFADVAGTPGGISNVANSGTISATGERRDGLSIDLIGRLTEGALALTNGGTVSVAGDRVNAVDVFVQDVADSRITLANSATIAATGAGLTGLNLGVAGTGGSTFAIVNSGTISATGDAAAITRPDGTTFDTTVGLLVVAEGVSGTIVNTATGTISTSGARSIALASSRTALVLDNAGTISGGPGAAGPGLASGSSLDTTSYYAGAIQSFRFSDDRVRNTGTILGSIDLGAGDDTLENRGTIRGDVFLRDGDDTFLQQASAVFAGTADGGAGTDLLAIDATGGGSVRGEQFVNFERLMQAGAGQVSYSGRFTLETIELAGSVLSVAAGDRLAALGPVTITGSTAGETVVNAETITGGIDLSAGDDRLDNFGAIEGAVLLGAGNDVYLEGVGATVGGGVDGGAGSDLYRVRLAGDRRGLAARTGFEQLSIEGAGTLSLALDQSFEVIALAGTSAAVTQGEFAVGQVLGSAAAESFATDGDVALAALDGGDDTLALGARVLSGRYDGGTGDDLLRLTAAASSDAGGVTLSGTATGFERIELTGGALTVAGTLGTMGASLAFSAGDQSVTVADGGTLAGLIELGAGNDTFRLAAGGRLMGAVTGGTGYDRAILELSADMAVDDSLPLFDSERLSTEGAGALTFAAGTRRFDVIDASGDLTVAAGAALGVDRLQFGARDNRLTIAGAFAGAVDGGAGADRIDVTGGQAAFSSITSVERLSVTGGATSIAGQTSLGTIDVTGGVLMALAGSNITASGFSIGSRGALGLAGSVRFGATWSSGECWRRSARRRSRAISTCWRGPCPSSEWAIRPIG